MHSSCYHCGKHKEQTAGAGSPYIEMFDHLASHAGTSDEPLRKSAWEAIVLQQNNSCT